MPLIGNYMSESQGNVPKAAVQIYISQCSFAVLQFRCGPKKVLFVECDVDDITRF